MMALFEGFRGAHGTHGSTDQNQSKGGKLEIKKSARTLREPVTEEVWRRHLSGDAPLGIIPIREDNTCLWGCVDVDKYDLDLGAVAAEIKKRNLPFVLCKTKSGGIHAFLFLTEPAPAEAMRAVLKNLAASMSWGDCEIFPKQNQVLVERGDLGNWLNMPYLSGDETSRYGLKENGMAMTLSEFLTHAESKRMKIQDVKVPRSSGERRGDTDSSVPFGDGPPCLQHLTMQGFPDGTRNNGLFALGIYAQKKFGESWKEHLEEMNRQYMKPPLSSEEVVGVVRNLEKKDYNYSCREVPLCSHCESAVCRGRKFGVGGGGQYPSISGLSKLATDPPIWFMDIEGDRVELNTKELQNYRDFQAACMDKLTIFFMPMKHEVWSQMVGEAMQSAVIIEAAADMSTEGHFMELLETFLMDRHRGERWDDIHQGRPFMDPDTNIHWFRLKDLMALLEREGFKEWGRNKVGRYIEERGFRKGRNVGGKFVNLLGIKDDKLHPTPQAVLPPVDQDPL